MTESSRDLLERMIADPGSISIGFRISQADRDRITELDAAGFNGDGHLNGNLWALAYEALIEKLDRLEAARPTGWTCHGEGFASQPCTADAPHRGCAEMNR